MDSYTYRYTYKYRSPCIFLLHHSGVLWEDPDFPAVDSSIFFSKKPPGILFVRDGDVIDKNATTTIIYL